LRALLYRRLAGGVLGGLLEGLVGLFTPTPEQYAETILPLVVAPELAAHSGALFGQGGGAILPSRAFREDPTYTERVMGGVEALMAKAAAAATVGGTAAAT
jgi:hypothetical protein